MTPEVLLNYAQIQDLHVADVATYLHQNNWTAVSHPNPRLMVFQNGLDDEGKPIQLVLPSQDAYQDAPYLLTKAINLLSTLQSISFQEILKNISSATSNDC